MQASTMYTQLQRTACKCVGVQAAADHMHIITS
jgi:hypothetical protein